LTILVNSISQHADQTFFLWVLRSAAIAAPHFSVVDVSELDERLEAHIDGLRIGGEEAWKLCLDELALEDPGAVFRAGVLSLESGDEAKIHQVLKTATKTPDLARGLVSALGWLDYQRAEPYIESYCASTSPVLRRIGIAAAAIHRKDPGQVLRDALYGPDPLLRARASRAVAELGRVDLVSVLQRDLNAKEESCRFWAAWSKALLVGYMDALQELKAIAEAPSAFRERALKMVLRRMDLNSAHSWQRRLAANPKLTRQAVIAAGVIGDPVLVPWIVQQMSTPLLARVAGEAFTMITGVDIAYDDLDTDKPEGFESGPTEDPKDENVEMDPDERLPWPDPKLIGKWWEENSARFQAGVRYLVGKPISMDWMQQVLRIGRQRQRAAAALELAIVQPGIPLFEVRAPGFRQQEILNK
jgi:uncharacterized protein (TIGR02270 family)